jgi:hypothetical protein
MADLSDTRRKNLNALCVRRGWVSQKNPLIGSPAKLIEVLGRTSSFWSDRLKPDGKPIGEDLAREIEQKLELGDYALDGLSGTFAGWPFSAELRLAVARLDTHGVRRAENVLRSHLGLNALDNKLGGSRPPEDPDQQSAAA